MIGSEIEFTTGCSYTPSQVLAKIVPGSVVTYDAYGTIRHLFVFTMDTNENLPGGIFIQGRKITKDGFVDHRSRKDDHYIARIQYVRNVTSPENVKWAFPYCQLRPAR